MKWRSYLIAAALAMGTVARPAQSQDWPSHPVKVIYSFAPGGAGDVILRLVLDQLSRKFAQSFVVDYRPGAAGAVGSNVVAKAHPDGYTLLYSAMASHVVAPAFVGTPYDPMKDFTHIALLGGPPLVLAVYPGFEAKTLHQYVEISRTRSKGIAFGSPGVGSMGHLLGERFRLLTGGKLVHVPYKGGGPVTNDLIAGHIASAFVTLGAAAPLYRSGKVRLLAVSSAARLPDFSDVPTFAEAGYKDLVVTAWFFLSGPASLPRQIVERLNAEVRAALAQPEVRKRLIVEGTEPPADLDADAFTAFFHAEIERWGPVARGAKSSGAKK